ncbi:MAG TPA: ABC transporter permease [Acidobacteriaceae bacterium]|nr:ABC transporter permease [Acidobacteriaceae bacterium]
MGAMREGWNRMLSFFHKPERDAEMEAELASHVELAVEENMRQGMPEPEARRKALVRIGGVQQARERQREARGLPWLDVLLQDVRYTLRTLRRDRSFTVVAVLILALGIGANIAVFSVVNTILLRPLPFPDSQRLIRITAKDPKGGESSMTYTTDATQEYQQRNKSFQQVTGYFAFTGPDNYKLGGHGVPLPVTGILVMGNFFQTLEVQPMLGRLFTADECLPKGRPAVLLSYPFWKRQFHANRDIVGQAIDLNNTPVTVVGVLPKTFDFGSVFSPGSKVDIFTPFIMHDFQDDGNALALIGRLKPGVTLAAAQAEADLLFPKLVANLRHPGWNEHYTARQMLLKQYVTGKLHRSLIVLWCAVGMILLIVCVNLSNLLLARTAARSKEFAMRTALGAGRGRLIRQLLTESLILSGAGALLGLGIAFAVIEFLAHQGSIALPLLSDLRIDGATLAWTVAVAIVSGAAFGLMPGLKMSSGNLQETLKDSGSGAGEGKKHEELRSALVISEVALACVLLVGAGLLLRSFLHILDVDLGFEPSHAAAISVEYTDGGNAAKRSAIWQEIIHRVEAIPGVETAGITDNLPLSRNRSWDISAKGQTYRPGELQDTFVFIVSPGYLRAIGMRLLAGRDVSWSDGPKSQSVVIINETVARKLWPGQDPIGRIAMVGGGEARVIGVIADVHESSVEGDPGWQMYLPATQAEPEGAQLVVRTKVPPDVLASSVMATLRQINPGQPATEFRPIQGLVDHAVSPQRFFVLLVDIFAGLGLLLASLGIYGVISYSVTQRTQEIGIRMALGASRWNVQWSVIWKTLRLVLVGMVVGLAASFAASRLIATLLYGTAATDPKTFGAVTLLLLGVALLAGYLPAWRASRINPMIALRNN